MSNRPVIDDFIAILGPFLTYYITIVIVMSVAQLMIGTGESCYTVCNIIASAAAIVVMLPYYRSERMLEGRNPFWTRETAAHIAMAAAITLLLGGALNNLISMSPLVAISKAYQEANRNFYGSALWIEVISSAVFTPVLEELVFRGIIFHRLKKMLGAPAAVPASALLFGIMHFNVVQFIYAFLIGIALALLMERAGHLCAAIAGHMAANLLAVVRTELGLFAEAADGSLFAWCVSAALLAAGIALLLWYVKFSFLK